MRQLGTEEKAALLLTSVDEDEDDHIDLESTTGSSKSRHDPFPVISKRPKTYYRSRTGTSHPMFFLILILSVFIFGCLTGVVIMLYRMSQDTNSSSLAHASDLTKIDLTIKNKLFQSITKSDFLNLNRTLVSETNAAKNLEENWQSLTKIFTRVNKLSYDVTLSTYSPSTQWSGIQLLNGKTDEELTRFNLLRTKDYLTFSSLVKSGQVNANFIYYVNYGRPEDFAYLIRRNAIQFENKDRTILFMRRDSNLISQTEQIRQVTHYKFAGLVLFDDEHSNEEYPTTNDRQSFSQEWRRLSTEKERQSFLEGTSNDADDHQIVVLILSYDDVQNIFSSVPADSNKWLPCPSQWHNQTTSLKIGGVLQQTKLRLTTFMQEVPVHLPIVLGYVHGTIEADHFIMVGYQLGRRQQEKVINKIIQIYGNQMHNGWHPRRSILFCAWSGSLYDRYTIHRWISDNYRLINRNLVAYIDLGNGITGNSTLNLHGSPLLQQAAQRAADAVVSPLAHDHTCHHRQASAMAAHAQTNQRRHAPEEHEHHMSMAMSTECEPHKLLDEWKRASNNRMGSNLSITLTQMMDTDSSAAIFQLQYGIPSILIEMTDEQALNNETFYLKKSPTVLKGEIQPEVLTAYTQFVSEVIRQLIDEPIIPFNLTDYATFIDRQTADYLVHFEEAYRTLGTHLGDSNEMTTLTGDLTKSIRRIQSHIDQIPKNDYIHLQGFNEKLIQFERLFIVNDQLHADETYKHALIGPAYGLTNTVVPYPSLSNLLFGLSNDSQSELGDTSKVYWSKLKKHVQLMTRTLNGFDGLLSNA